METQTNGAPPFTTVEQIDSFLRNAAAWGANIPAERRAVLAALRKELEAQEAQDSATPLYSKMKAIAQRKYHITEEFDSCVRRTVDKLLADGCDYNKPGLLLGNIQCGKTNTFEHIIALAFDKGIEVCVIFTKGTKTLASQTLARAKADFAFARRTDDINGEMKVIITDIMDLRNNGVSTIDTDDDHCRQIIICKKETRNLDSLIKLYDNCPNLRTERTLVIDDEADFASRVYKGRGQDTELAKISRQIETFRKIPTECRYLEVTATPYSLYLQPDGTILTPHGENLAPWRPNFTELVPVHDKYIGGKQYFEESQDENSMYSHLFVPVSEKCLKMLAKRNERFLKSTYRSEITLGLSTAICGYFMAAAIRSLQSERMGKRYHSSCLIHIQTGKSGHEWESELVTTMIRDIRKVLLENGVDVWLGQIMDGCYADFAESNRKGKAAGLLDDAAFMPTEDEVMAKVRKLITNDYQVRVVNSDNSVQSMLNEDGQLSIESYSMNIFIGGSILDRGITVGNMLCFFYGRNPKTFQMDTVLQHARMYGSRSKEDMAVTRFFTTNRIYNVLAKIHKVDTLLREQFTTRDENGNIVPSEVPIIIGVEKGITPSAKNKIKITKTEVVKPHSRFLPFGFQVGGKKDVKPIVATIDNLIKSQPGFSEQEGFLIPEGVAARILYLIEKTYVYGVEYGNVGYESNWNSALAISIMRRGLQETSDRKVWCIFRGGRQVGRIRENGAFLNTPETGSSEGDLAHQLATDRPALILLRQEGSKAQKWSGTPFYWPVMITPENFKPGMFAHDEPKEFDEEEVGTELKELIRDIPKEEILRLNIKKGFLMDIYFGFKTSEHRQLQASDYGKYIETTKDGKPKLAEGVDPAKIDADIFSLNDGEFPFILKKYKYMLLTCTFGAGDEGKLLVRLKDIPDTVSVYPEAEWYGDVLHDAQGGQQMVTINNVYTWAFDFELGEVLGPRQPEFDRWKEEHPEEFENTSVDLGQEE